MRRVDGQRGEDGEDALHEVGVEPVAVGVIEFVEVGDDDAGVGEAGADVFPGALLLAHQDAGFGFDFGKLLRGGSPVLGGGGEAGLGLADQAGDAHGVEFVEVGGGDGDEAQAFEQGMARVFGLLDDAAVEGEPGEFAVDEAGRVAERDRLGQGRVLRLGGAGDVHRARVIGRGHRALHRGGHRLHDQGVMRREWRGIVIRFVGHEIGEHGFGEAAGDGAAGGQGGAVEPGGGEAQHGGGARQMEQEIGLDRFGDRELAFEQEMAEQNAQQIVLGRADAGGGDGAQAAGEVGQGGGPARRRQAGREEDGPAGFGGGVEQMEQGVLGGGGGVVDGERGIGQAGDQIRVEVGAAQDVGAFALGPGVQQMGLAAAGRPPEREAAERPLGGAVKPEAGFGVGSGLDQVGRFEAGRRVERKGELEGYSAHGRRPARAT